MLLEDRAELSLEGVGDAEHRSLGAGAQGAGDGGGAAVEGLVDGGGEITGKGTLDGVVDPALDAAGDRPLDARRRGVGRGARHIGGEPPQLVPVRIGEGLIERRLDALHDLGPHPGQDLLVELLAEDRAQVAHEPDGQVVQAGAALFGCQLVERGVDHRPGAARAPTSAPAPT